MLHECVTGHENGGWGRCTHRFYDALVLSFVAHKIQHTQVSVIFIFICGSTQERDCSRFVMNCLTRAKDRVSPIVDGAESKQLDVKLERHNYLNEGCKSMALR